MILLSGIENQLSSTQIVVNYDMYYVHLHVI